MTFAEQNKGLDLGIMKLINRSQVFNLIIHYQKKLAPDRDPVLVVVLHRH